MKNKRANYNFFMNKKGKNRFLMNKKALVIGFIITLILAILGFLILLFFYYQINWTGKIDREVCHQSVIYRGTLPGFGNAKDYVPLKCKTQKVCITSGFFGGECDEFKNEKGVVKVKVKHEDEIAKFIAMDILDCWETMGEGKISLFNQWFTDTFGFGEIISSCVICSRISFDRENLQKAGIRLEDVDVQDYMLRHKVPGKEESYFVYLTGSGGKLSVKDNRVDGVKIEGDEGELQDGEISIGVGEIEVEDLAVMFMQVYAPNHETAFKNSLKTLVGGSVGSAVLMPKFTKVVLKSPFTWAVLAVVGIYQYNSVSEGMAASASYCGDISVGDEAGTGCSVVRTVNYGAEDLGTYCSKIESIP